MMLCEKCGKNKASAFVKSDSNNVQQEMYICSSCASEKENDVSLGLFSNNETSASVCDCSATFEEISQSGYVGCEKCYKTFKNELESVILSMHGSLVHKGKKPCTRQEVLKQQIKKAYENNFLSLAQKLEKELERLEGECDYE